MRYRGPLPKQLVGAFNARIARLRESPRFGPLVRRHLTILTYTGRRSGRVFSTPVGYRRAGEIVTIGVRLPAHKTWWRNFTGEGGPLALELDGADRTGHGTARVDDKGRVTVTVRLDRPEP